MLSTVHTSATVGARGGSTRMKPQCVVGYIGGMKGVDLGDQLAASSPSVRRSLRWHKSCSYIYELAMMSNHALCRMLGHHTNLVDFQVDGAMSVINDFAPQMELNNSRGRPSTAILFAILREVMSYSVGDPQQKEPALLHMLSCRGMKMHSTSTLYL